MDYSDFYFVKKAKNSIFACCSDSETTERDELVVDENNSTTCDKSFSFCCDPIADGFDNCEICDIEKSDTTIALYQTIVMDNKEPITFVNTPISEFKFDKLSKPTGIMVSDDNYTPVSDVLEKITMLTFNTGLLELKLLGMQVYQNPPYTQRRLMQMPGELNNANSDVIALQEVYARSHAQFLTTHMKSNYPYIVRNNFVNHEFLAKHNISFCRPKSIRSKFRNKALFHHGLMFFSKFPIVFSYFHSWRDVTNLEGIFGNKGFMEVICDVPSVGLVAFFNIHMASAALNPESKQIEQLRLAEVKQLFEAVSVAIENKTIPIVIGDLNASPDNCPNQGWIDCWKLAKRVKSKKSSEKDVNGINSGLWKTIQSLKKQFSSSGKFKQIRRQVQSQQSLFSPKPSDKKLSLRIKDFRSSIFKINKSNSTANCADCCNPSPKLTSKLIVERLNNIGVNRHKSGCKSTERFELDKGIDDVLVKNVFGNGKNVVRMTRAIERYGYTKYDLIYQKTPEDFKDDFICKRSNSWYLFNTHAHSSVDYNYDGYEDEYSTLETMHSTYSECPESLSFQNDNDSIKIMSLKSGLRSINSKITESIASYSYSGRSRGSSGITISNGSYRVNFFSKYNRFDSYHRKSYSPRNRLPGYTQFGRRRIIAIKKNNNRDEYTWDPMNPLNKIGPHSSCSGLRCDYIFLPPSDISGSLSKYTPKWSEIMFTEPCVFVDQDTQSCNFAYSICMSMKKVMLVTMSDHYALKIVLVRKGSKVKY